jgi:hypothetical protein
MTICSLSGENRVYQFQELFAPEIHPAATFRDPFIDFTLLLVTLLLTYSFLILSIRLFVQLETRQEATAQ